MSATISLSQLAASLPPETLNKLQLRLMFGRVPTIGTDLTAVIREVPELEEVRAYWQESDKGTLAETKTYERICSLVGQRREEKDYFAFDKAQRPNCPAGSEPATWVSRQWEELHRPGGESHHVVPIYGWGAPVAVMAWVMA